MKILPKFLERYFWDVDFKKLDAKNHPEAIIGRILEHGDKKAVGWLRKHFPKKAMADVLFRFRFVSPKSANFWGIIFNLPRGKILCLQKHYQKKLQGHWPY